MPIPWLDRYWWQILLIGVPLLMVISIGAAFLRPDPMHGPEVTLDTMLDDVNLLKVERIDRKGERIQVLLHSGERYWTTLSTDRSLTGTFLENGINPRNTSIWTHEQNESLWPFFAFVVVLAVLVAAMYGAIVAIKRHKGRSGSSSAPH